MRITLNASALTVMPDLKGLVQHATKAAEDGFTGWWLAQTGMVDALTVFAAIGDSAPSLELGTAVIPTFPRHPSMLAAQANTTQAATSSKLLLGIGLSHKPQVEDRWGLSFDKPIRHMLDYLDILQPLLADGIVDHHGGSWTMSVPDPMPLICSTEVPVMIAALGPQMLKIAGSRTDGTILWMVGEKTIAEHIEPTITAAASQVGRPDPRIMCSLPLVITDNPQEVKDFASVALKIYGELPSYRAMLDREGADGPADVCLIGSEEEVADRLGAIRDAGATEFAAVEFGLNDDDAARTREFLKRQITEMA